MENKLVIENLSKEYSGKLALNDVSFEVKNGEFLSILGPSGCGKTTLLRILVGLMQPTSGKIYKEGEDITSLPASKRGMGIVFQNYALFENMTAIENVSYALKVNKVPKSDANKTANELLTQLGLGEYINKKPVQLSGGQQQRVAIARTLAMKPDIILFDEPMSALDVDTRLSLRDEIKDIQKKYKTTMIYITHDQEEAFAMSDRIMIMEKANLVQIDTPENIIKNPVNDYVQSFVIDNLHKKINSLRKYI